MRWPLRRQILLPMVGILLLTVGVVSALNAWLASRSVQRQLETQLDDVAQTFSAGNFPLESNVLRQTRGLTGAEYVVTNSSGQPLAASDDSLLAATRLQPAAPRALDLSQIVGVGGRTYYHAASPLDRRPVGGGQAMLHVYYPEGAWREARWRAVWPPLAIGIASALLVAAAAVAAARHVTQPIRQLRSQVERIAGGDFTPVPAPARDDELRDLAVAVNQMAVRLAHYETETRNSERLQTLGTLGGGIAHQIRNAATGCRIALDLHERDCPLAIPNGETEEPLQVATRQLELIETHVQRFLTLGRPAGERLSLSVSDVVDEAVSLIQPMARHVGVRLIVARPLPAEELLEGDRQALVQMLVNLLVNGVEATAKTRVTAAPGPPADEQAVVLVQCECSENECRLTVSDPGPGPAAAIQGRLFEPFATDKPGGTGLGLVVSRRIAEDHGGALRWERNEEKTRFIVTLPRRKVLPA